MIKEYERMSKSERERAYALMEAAKNEPIDYSDIPKQDLSKYSNTPPPWFVEMKKSAAERLKKEMSDAIAESKEKFDSMTAYLLMKINTEIPLVKLNKLLFYCDFLHYKKYKTPLTGIPYVHLGQGPVPAGNVSYSLFDDMDRARIINMKDEENGDSISTYFSATKRAAEFAEKLSDIEKNTIDYVIERLEDKSGTELSKISHDEDAYRETEDNEVIYYSAFADTLKI